MAKRSALLALVTVMTVVAGNVIATAQTPASMFAPALLRDVGPGSGQVVLIDLNRDGHVDLITRHLLQQRIRVFLGDGKGGLQAVANDALVLEYRPGMIAVADVNGDSFADIAVASSDRDDVDLFFGNGKGGFARAPGAPYSTSDSRESITRGVQLADTNNDQRLDIIIFNGLENTFAILLGDGRGHFSPGPRVKGERSRQTRYTFAFGDLDRNGYIDAVIGTREASGREPGRLAILWGDENGGFKERTPPLKIEPNPHFITLGDINGDRVPDIVVSHGNSTELTLLINDRGTFSPAPASPLDIGTEAYDIVIEDVNADKRPDLLVATAGSATVLLNNGQNRFVDAPGSPFEATRGAYRLAAVDIDGNGKLDLVTSSFETNRIAVLLAR